MFFFGVAGLFTAACAPYIGVVYYCFLVTGTGAACGFAAGVAMKNDMSSPPGGCLRYMIGAGVTDAVAGIMFVIGIFTAVEMLPIVVTLASFASGVAVLLAYAFLKERPTKIQWCGIAIAIAGICALSYLA